MYRLAPRREYPGDTLRQTDQEGGHQPEVKIVTDLPADLAANSHLEKNGEPVYGLAFRFMSDGRRDCPANRGSASTHPKKSPSTLTVYSLPTFPQWLEHRQEGHSKATRLAIQIAQSGAAGVSLARLRRLCGLPPQWRGGTTRE